MPNKNETAVTEKAVTEEAVQETEKTTEEKKTTSTKKGSGGSNSRKKTSGSTKKEEPKNVYTLSISSDVDKGEITVGFTPKLEDGGKEEAQQHLNNLLAGIHIALHSIMADIPVMRPATELERESQLYIFKDEENDNRLYNTRKQLHDGLGNVFTNILKEVFPDIEYIQGSIQHQQELALNMNPKEVADYQKQVKEIADKVRAMKDEDEDEGK